MILDKSKRNKDLAVSASISEYDFKTESQLLDSTQKEHIKEIHDANNKNKVEKESTAKPKGIPKSLKTFGGSTLDESVKGEKDIVDDLTYIPNMKLLQQEIKQAKKQSKLAAQKKQNI